MKRTRLRIALVAVLTLALGVVGARGLAFGETQAPADTRSTLQRELDNAVNTAVFGKFVPGGVGMLRDGDHREYASTGFGDLFQRIPADPQAKFRIGSNTKAFVATVVLQLVDEGRLSLDDTVDKHLPGVVNANGNDGTKMTIRQLLNHTSGLADHVWNLAKGAEYLLDMNPHRAIDPMEHVATALQEKPKFQPGEGFFYSNTGYVLAGMIVEKVTGQHIGTEIQQRIIEPLGLSNTSYPVNDPTLSGNWIHGYFWVRDVSYSNVDFFGASAAMVSTLDDMSTFIQALLSGQLMSPTQLAQMQTTVSGDGFSERFQGWEGYGLGIVKAQTPCGEVWGHTGAVLGYRSYWFATPDGTRQTISMVNEYHVLGDGTDALMHTGLANAICEGRTS